MRKPWLRDGRAVETHLLELGSDLEAGVVATHQKGGDTVRAGYWFRRRHDDVHLRLAGVGDEDLGAVQDIATVTAGRGGLEMRGV
jgi:hypothetical protein